MLSSLSLSFFVLLFCSLQINKNLKENFKKKIIYLKRRKKNEKREKKKKEQKHNSEIKRENKMKAKLKYFEVLNLLRGTYQSLSLLHLQYYCNEGCVLEKEKEKKRGGREKRERGEGRER